MGQRNGLLTSDFLQTACLSVGVGKACTAAAPGIILEALVITGAIVAGLTVYAFRAARKGQVRGSAPSMISNALAQDSGWF